MIKLCLVSYISGKETFTKAISSLASLLADDYPNFNCVIFTEGSFLPPPDVSFPIKQVRLAGTKYKRMKQLIQDEDADYYISVDNDIEFSLPTIKQFIQKVVDENYDVGWGKILAKPSSNFVSRLVEVDKNLSHHYIRPLLWKSGFGITIPGQCFMIKRDAFRERLPEVDTYLDDLALGLCVNLNSNVLKIYRGKEIVGYEESNDSLLGLFKQRARWAHGFMSILKSTTSSEGKKLITIHGLSYHSLWLIHWACICVLLLLSPMAALIYVLATSLVLTNMNFKIFAHGISYQFIFPVFHMRWFQCVLAELKCKY